MEDGREFGGKDLVLDLHVMSLFSVIWMTLMNNEQILQTLDN